jgi:predicted RecA/RadA family phage recombinase
MKNFIMAGVTVTATAPSGGVSSGDGVLIGSLFGVAAGSADAGNDVELTTMGVFDLPKASGAVTFGAPLYWDADAKTVTTVASTTAGDNTLIGVATADADVSASTARIRLNGSFGSA